MILVPIPFSKGKAVVKLHFREKRPNFRWQMLTPYHQRDVLMPAYEDMRIRRGRGLGEILSGIFRKGFLPLTKTVGKSLNAGAKRTAFVLKDVSRGSSIKWAMKKQEELILFSLIESVLTQLPTAQQAPSERRRVVKCKQHGRQPANIKKPVNATFSMYKWFAFHIWVAFRRCLFHSWEQESNCQSLCYARARVKQHPAAQIYSLSHPLRREPRKTSSWIPSHSKSWRYWSYQIWNTRWWHSLLGPQ